VGSTNSLARTIARFGAVAIVVWLVPFWVTVVYDLHTYGLRRFWLMAMFVLLYSYLALPLLFEFAKILKPAPRAERAQRRRTAGKAPRKSDVAAVAA